MHSYTDLIFHDPFTLSMTKAAVKAGEYLAKVFEDRRYQSDLGINLFEAREKTSDLNSVPDYVTQHDLYAERTIRDVLKVEHPDIAVVGEEGDKEGRSSDAYFLVDPCDGTKNFTLGIPYFAVCIAYISGNEVLAGVVYDPSSHKVYWAGNGQGAYVKNIRSNLQRRIHANQETDPRKVLIVAEESYGDALVQKASIARLTSLAPHFAGIRKFGSTALDLVNVADAQPVSIVASGLKSWDFAPGYLIAREAGAIVTDFEGRPLTLQSDTLLAAPTRPLMRTVLAAVQQADGVGL